MSEMLARIIRLLRGGPKPPRDWAAETDARSADMTYNVSLTSKDGRWEGEWTGFAWSEANAASRARNAVGQMAVVRYAWPKDRAIAWSGALIPNVIQIRLDPEPAQSAAIRSRQGRGDPVELIPAALCIEMAAMVLRDIGRDGNPDLDVAVKIGAKGPATTDAVEAYVQDHLKSRGARTSICPRTMTILRHLAAAADISGGDQWRIVRARFPEERGSATRRAALRAQLAQILRDAGETEIADGLAAAA